MKFFSKDFFSKCDQIRSFLRIWSHLVKKFLMENFIFCAVCASFRKIYARDFIFKKTKVFGRKIKETALVMYFIKVTLSAPLVLVN